VARIASGALAKSSKLTSEILVALGITCLRVSSLAGHAGRSKLVIGGISDRKSAGKRLWFPSRREADKVMQATLSRCMDSKKTAAGLTVNLPPDDVVNLVNTIALSLGIRPFHDADVATTFNSINGRVEIAIKALGREGTLKRLRRITEFDLDGLLARQSV
jgi:hypothetical protein